MSAPPAEGGQNPYALSYSSYVGPVHTVAHTAVDARGRFYLAATSNDGGYPTKNAIQGAYGGKDAVVSKLSSDGRRLIYSTFYGSADNDRVTDIAVDESGDAYVTGFTFGDFPETPNPAADCTAGPSVFVIKLDPRGQLLYATCIGGGRSRGIAIAPDGSAVVTGQAYSSSDSYPTAYRYGAIQGSKVVFVSKLGPDGSQLEYTALLYGESNQYGDAVAVDSDGQAFVTGYTDSISFPTTPDSLQGSRQGESDAFLSELSPDGSTLVYSSYVGTSGRDNATCIRLGTDNQVYLGGITRESTEATLDGWFAEVVPSENPYRLFRRVGTTGSDEVYDIDTDSRGRIYLFGETASLAFPTRHAVQAKNAGFIDLFVIVFRPDGLRRVFATYLGGNREDFAGSISVTPSGSIYLGGTTRSRNFPLVRPFEKHKRGGLAAFVARLS